MTASIGKRPRTPTSDEPQTPSKRAALTPSKHRTPEAKAKRMMAIQKALEEAKPLAGKDTDASHTPSSAQKQKQKQALLPLPSIDNDLRNARSPLSKPSPEMDSEEEAFWTSTSTAKTDSHHTHPVATSSRAAAGFSSAGYCAAGPSRMVKSENALPTPPRSSPPAEDSSTPSSSPAQVSQALRVVDDADNEVKDDVDNPFHALADSVPSTPRKMDRASTMREHVNELLEMVDYVATLERKMTASEKSLKVKNDIIINLKKENEELKAELANAKR